MSQCLMLGPILFNTFLTNLFWWHKNSDLHNFLDDSTISVTCNNLTSLCHAWKKWESAIVWYKNNSIIAFPGKSWAIILTKDSVDVTHNWEFTISKQKLQNLWSNPNGLETDFQFNEHRSTLCSEVAMQLKALYRLQRYMGRTEKNAMINFIYPNFNYLV